MILTLVPIVGLPGQPETTIELAGEVLTVDGASFDLGAVPEGGEAQPDGAHPFIGTITRESGVLRAAVLVRLDGSAADDQPESPWTVTVDAGPVAIPAARKETRE